MDEADDNPDPITLTPIGVVHSPVQDRRAMPAGGVPAQIEVFRAYMPGLVDIASNSHLVILAWLHQAPRDRLQAEGRHAPPTAPLRGVFGLRAQMRPNPVALTPARLLGIDLATGYLQLDRLDFIDGTPVIDIKRYAPGFDCIFSAHTSRDTAPPTADLRDDLIRDAVHFHGEWCAGAAVGVVLLQTALEIWQTNGRHPALRVQVGRDGCLADALQGMTGTTLGNGRLRVAAGPTVSLEYQHGDWSDEIWQFTPEIDPGQTPESILAQPLMLLGRWDRLRRAGDAYSPSPPDAP